MAVAAVAVAAEAVAAVAVAAEAVAAEAVAAEAVAAYLNYSYSKAAAAVNQKFQEKTAAAQDAQDPVVARMRKMSQ